VNGKCSGIYIVLESNRGRGRDVVGLLKRPIKVLQERISLCSLLALSALASEDACHAEESQYSINNSHS
jgi:hypothetical protein